MKIKIFNDNDELLSEVNVPDSSTSSDCSLTEKYLWAVHMELYNNSTLYGQIMQSTLKEMGCVLEINGERRVRVIKDPLDRDEMA
jgi:hypothetical protein